MVALSVKKSVTQSVVGSVLSRGALRKPLFVPYAKTAAAYYGLNILNFSATRNSSKTVKDFEGNLHTLQAHEFAGEGARIGRNLFYLSSGLITDTLENAVFGTIGGASISGEVLSMPSANDGAEKYLTVGLLTGGTFLASVVLSGIGSVQVTVRDNTNSERSATLLTLTSTPTRYSFPITFLTSTATDFGMQFRRQGGATATAITGSDIQYERVTLQSNQNPSEYAPVGTPTGSELVINGTFDTDSDWSKGTGWTISGGVATHTGGTADYLSTALSYEVGKKYYVVVEVVTADGANFVQVYLGSNPALVSLTTTGTHTVVGTYLSGVQTVSIRGIRECAITSVSLHEATTGLIISDRTNGNTVSSNVVTEATGVLLRDTVTEKIGNSAAITRQARYSAFTNSEVLAVGDHRAKADRKYTDVSKAAYLDGVSGSYVSTPDSAAASVTGDIDIRVRATMDDWTTGATSLVAKQSGTSQRSYRFELANTTGAPVLAWSPDGTTNNTVTSSGTDGGAALATGFTDGTEHWLRVTRNATSGNIDFYVSENGTDWVAHGVTQTDSSGSLNDATSPLEIGSTHSGTLQLVSGSVSEAQIYNGIDGTLAVSFDANDYSTGSTLDTTIGSELVTNGDFDTGISGWTASDAGATLSYQAGELRIENGDGTAAGANRSFSVTAGVAYTLSFDSAVGTASTAGVQFGIGSNTNSFNQALKTDTTNGKHSLTFVAGTTTTYYFLAKIRSVTLGEYIQLDNVSVKEVTRWTLNGSADTVKPGTVLSTIESTDLSTVIDDTIANGGVLFDIGYHTIRGVLGETFAATNSVLHSEDLTQSTLNNTTVNANSGTAPDGSLTADDLVDDATSGSHLARLAGGLMLTTGNDWCQSFFVKYIDHQWVSINNGQSNCYFDLLNQVVGTDGYTNSGIELLGDGWMRIYAGEAITPTNKNYDLYMAGADNVINYVGTGTKIRVWGTQANIGTTPSSYIATTTAAVTRVAEGFTQSLDNFSQDAGTLIGTARFPLAKADMPAANSGVFGVRDNTLTLLYMNNGNLRSYDAVNLAQAPLGYLAGEEVTMQVTWDSSISKFQIWGTSDSGGTVTSGLVTYDGAFVIGTVLNYLYGMSVPVNLLDWVLTKSAVFTDKTGKDS